MYLMNKLAYLLLLLQLEYKVVRLAFKVFIMGLIA